MEVETEIWVKHGDEQPDSVAWVRGKVAQKDDKTIQVKLDDSNETRTFDTGAASTADELKLCNVSDNNHDGTAVDDLISLTHLHEPAILHSLQVRFDKDIIYTATGPILLAVNPFKRLNDIYKEDILRQYNCEGRKKALGESYTLLGPHVYESADNAFHQMVYNPTGKYVNQSILVSGESGAGKTETTKFIMRYIATIAGSATEMVTEGSFGGANEERSIEQKVLESNPIMEAFGNARTIRNDNSSRFGKYIKLQFNEHPKIIGASIQTYLLEKVRIVYQAEDERNYHVFYEMSGGASDEERQEWMLGDMEDVHYINQSGCYERRDGVKDAKGFEWTRHAMTVMDFPESEQVQIFKVVAAVMQLGNVEFATVINEADEDSSRISDETQESFARCAKLLDVEEDMLLKALTTKKIKAVSEMIEVGLDPAKALEVRDGITKTVYSQLFEYLVKRINSMIRQNKGISCFVGVLDIFGFEIFTQNGFEQLCINYANETLQQQFNTFIFKMEQTEYEREQIQWSFIDFPDNQPCLDMIEDRLKGVLAQLDEVCMLSGRSSGNDDETLANKLYQACSGHAHFAVSSSQRVNFQFVVKHYAGAVCYDSEGFCDRNRDAIMQEAVDMIHSSTNTIVKSFLADGADGQPKARKSSMSNSLAAKKKERRLSSIKMQSVGSQFKSQLNELMSTIRATHPHYVRCIKPNDLNTHGTFWRNRVVEQLRCGGVLEAVRVARAGYPTRLTHLEFVLRYRMLEENLARR
jgi:myosin-5